MVVLTVGFSQASAGAVGKQRCLLRTRGGLPSVQFSVAAQRSPASVGERASFSSPGTDGRVRDSSFLRGSAVLCRLHVNVHVLESEDVTEQCGLKRVLDEEGAPRN